MKIALIAHDKKKQDMVQFTTAYRDILRHHDLYATGTTGLKIQEATGLQIERFQSGFRGRPANRCTDRGQCTRSCHLFARPADRAAA